MFSALYAESFTSEEKTADLYKYRSKDQRYNRHQLNKNVNGRTGSIFERITDRIADDSRFMRFGALAAVMAFLNILLRIVPCAAGVCHKDS